MQQSITTKRLSPTNAHGTRIKAISTSGISVVITWDYELSDIENHWRACQALCKKLKWTGTFTTGYLNDGYMFVPVTNEQFTI